MTTMDGTVYKALLEDRVEDVKQTTARHRQFCLQRPYWQRIWQTLLIKKLSGNDWCQLAYWNRKSGIMHNRLALHRL